MRIDNILKTSEYVPSILLELEEAIDRLREKPNSSSIIKRIEGIIKKFTKIKKVYFSVYTSNTIEIFTTYKDSFSRSIVRGIRDIFGNRYKKKIENPEKIKK